MADSVLTRPSLLARIKDTGDRQAWAEFVDIYAPLIYGYALKQGLQDADAADLTQEVLGAVARSAARLDYDPARGTFRGWLFRVVRNELADFGAARRRHRPGTGDTAVQASAGGGAGPVGGRGGGLGAGVRAATVRPGAAGRSAATSRSPPGRPSG